RQQRSLAPNPDDHHRLCRRHDSAGDLTRRRLRFCARHLRNCHRWTDLLPAVDPVGDAGRLLAVRRSLDVDEVLSPPEHDRQGRERAGGGEPRGHLSSWIGEIMRWYHYIAYFFGGAFFANFIPHFVNGISGNPFQSPFASPPGEGLSSAMVNVGWGLGNLVV